MDVVLRPPKPADYPALTALCLQSKAVHGYDAAFMAACEDELRVDAARFATGPAMAAETADGRLVGYAQVVADADGCWLEALFVAPGEIGMGLGRRLFDWAVEAARGLGAAEMVIESDPGSASFYRAMGAVDAGSAFSGSIPGRSLPRLVFAL